MYLVEIKSEKSLNFRLMVIPIAGGGRFKKPAEVQKREKNELWKLTF